MHKEGFHILPLHTDKLRRVRLTEHVAYMRNDKCLKYFGWENGRDHFGEMLENARKNYILERACVSRD